MRLDEIAQQPVVNRQAIIVALADMGIESISTINADGSVDVNGDVRIPNSYTEIPVQFRNVSGSFNCSNTGILSLQYAPQQVGSNFFCHDTQITSLHNIHKTHANWVIGRKIVVPDNCTHILGLAFIQGIRGIDIGATGTTIQINHNDPFEWQEQLIEMGLIEQAQL
jgi:hypothetical protein